MQVIKNAKGLCIFTTMRTGLWVSGSGGSGVLVAKMPNGEWSPPSGILMHTAGLGFLIGVDIYDCVIVINNDKALEAFTKVRCTLGGEISAAAGPVGIGGVMDSEVHKRQSPIWTYIKSRGFYAGVQIDGTIVIERTDENENFYHERIPVADILAGKVRHPPYEIRTLMATLTAAEGGQVDEELLPEGPPPGDFEVEEPGHVFGVPDKEDPDPYGVLALEKEGMQVREAGTRDKPTYEEFTFNPSPSSPVQNILNRRSVDSRSLNGVSRRGSWRASAMSTASKMTDTATQTDEDEASPRSPLRDSLTADSRSRMSGDSPTRNSSQLKAVSPAPIAEATSPPPPIVRAVPPALPPRLPPRSSVASPPPAPPVSAPEPIQDDSDDADNEDEDDGAIIEHVQTAAMPTSPPATAVQVNKPKIVTVRNVPAPALPVRSAARTRGGASDAGSDATGGHSPTRSFVSERKVDDSSIEAATGTESISSLSEAKASPEKEAAQLHDAATVTTEDTERVDLDEHHGSASTPAQTHVMPSSSERKSEAVDGFQDVDLSRPVESPKPVQLREVVHKEATEEEKRNSRDVAVNLAANMRADMSDSEDDTYDHENGIRKTPGGW